MRIRRYLVLLVLLAVAGLADAPSASAAPAAVTLHATINGRDVRSSSASHPVRLQPPVPATVQVTITNKRTSAVNVRRVELTGRVIGLSFFAFDTSVGLNVPAGATDTLSYSLDLTGLRGQATGLMGGAVTVFDDHGHRVAREGMISDVGGSIFSVYGLFGFALLLLTLLAIVDFALAIARHGLPSNRWRSGMRALTPGVGIGLVIVFTLSAAHIAVPTGSRWLEAAVGFAVVFFVLGYLAPTPADPDDYDELDDGDDAGNLAAAGVAGPRAHAAGGANGTKSYGERPRYPEWAARPPVTAPPQSVAPATMPPASISSQAVPPPPAYPR